MKYEAKADNDGDGIGDINYSTAYNTWPADSYPISTTRKLVSTAIGYPVANISQATSQNVSSLYTANCDVGCHLITEAEWMTIAQNVLSVSSNWSDGAVGNGYFYSGHNDSNPNDALEADINDSNGYYGTGQSSPSNQRRTLTLSNGEIIWDMSGNAYEWTQGVISGGKQPGILGESSYSSKEWNNVSLLMNGLPITSQPSSMGISGINSWTTSQGIGRIYSNYGEAVEKSFRRGGYWCTGTEAGILTLTLYYPSSGVHPDVGFRVVKS